MAKVELTHEEINSISAALADQIRILLLLTPDKATAGEIQNLLALRLKIVIAGWNNTLTEVAKEVAHDN